MKTTLLSTDEVARITGRTVETVREWIKDGKLPATKTGRAYTINEGDLKTFLEDRHG